QERREPLLESDGNSHALDPNRRAGVEQVLSERQVIAIEVAHDVVAQPVRTIANLLRDLDTVRAMKFVQPVDVAADDEVDRGGVLAGCRRPLVQEHLDFIEIDAREVGWIAFGKRMLKAEFLGIEVDGGADLTNRQSGMRSLAFDGWGHST